MNYLEELQPNPKNPRFIHDEDYEKLKNSITGFTKMLDIRPIAYDENNVIWGGNMRFKALQDLHNEGLITEVKDSWFKELEGFTEDEKREFAIRDNKEFGEWDWDVLANEWDDLPLDDWGIDTGGIGKDEVVEDEPPELDETEVFSKQGEIYQLGRHRLMCGDSTKIEDVEKLMDGQKADMVFTDPPYNVDYGANKTHPSHKIRAIQNDSMDSDAWLVFTKDWVSACTSFNVGDVYIWGASGPDGMVMRLLLIELGYHWSATIIWKKNRLVLSPAKYQRIYEPCFYGWHKSNKSSYVGDRKQVELWELNSDVIYGGMGEVYVNVESVDLDVWEFERPTKSPEHPTMKPIEICANGIRNSSKKNDIVLDLFGGSGSTLIACEQLSRRCYMMELDPKYCDVIRKRYAKFIGKEDNWQEVTPLIN